MSTPKFIKCLTELSERLGMMRGVPKEQKKKILQDELILINQHLPASVYIPFVGNSTRNNCVLHIPPEEARVFQTKERAPILLCIEVFRPDEMSVIINQQNKQKQLQNKIKKNRKTTTYRKSEDGDAQERLIKQDHVDNPYLSVESPQDQK